MSFASSFELGMKLAEQQRLHADDNAIEAAGKKVAERNAEKDRIAKIEQDRAQEQLLASVKPTQGQQSPSTYQQGDSLGLQGYQTGNKPVQTTVPTAPPGYMSKGDNTFENDLSPGGLDYPSANPATEQTLLGNYGTTESFKGEAPTQADILRMQQDTTDQFQDRPFTGKNEQVNNLTDLAANKPETTQEAAKPKLLDTLNDHITAADNAKKSFEFNMEVLRELEKDGNTKAALAYKDKVASTELTLAQAQQVKFNTTASISTKVGNLASNALEDIQQPGADVNKIYYDFATRIKDEFGYTGKIVFSLDPKENIKTLDKFQKDAMTVTEKSEFNIKTANSQIEKNIKLNKLAMDQDELTLKKLAEARAQGKENREETQATFTRYVEKAKILQTGMNALNEYQDKDTKKAYKAEMDITVDKIKSFEKNFGVKSSINFNSLGIGEPTSTQIGNPASTAPITTQTKTSNSTPGTYTVDLNKPTNKTAGGFEPPIPKTPDQEKKESTDKANKIKQLKATIESAQKALNPGMETASDIERRAQLRVKAKQNREAVSEVLTGKKKRQALEESLLKAQKELEALIKS
jgi:hypothetical protein